MLHLLTPPGEGGIQDFSRRLVERLGNDCRLFPLTRDSVQGAMGTDEVFLQFVGYGFAKRGAPLWLLDAIKFHRPRLTWLGVFFHELFAFGPPWRSSFWMCPFQKWVTSQLAGLSDAWLTNREISEKWLVGHGGDRPHKALPVFSTIGVEGMSSPYRAPWLIVFGGPEVRRITYEVAGDRLFRWANLQGLQIHDIGPPVKDSRLHSKLTGEEVVIHGRLNAPDVCNLLKKAQFGLLSYLTPYVAKSSVFAAYAAHSVCPILISKSYPIVDGLTPGVQYLPWRPIQAGHIGDPRAVGEAAWDWYQGHSLEIHVETINNFRRMVGRTHVY